MLNTLCALHAGASARMSADFFEKRQSSRRSHARKMPCQELAVDTIRQERPQSFFNDARDVKER